MRKSKLTVRVRGNSSAFRRGGAFSFSLGIHAAALGWVIVSATLGFGEKPRPIYDAEIRPYESKIIWYHLQTRVPNVSPVEAKLTPKPARATRKLDQNLIAGAKELPTPPQKIWVPEPPKVEPPKPKIEALPNLLAVAPEVKRPLRRFVPPPAVPAKAKPAEKIPEAPEVALLRQAAITSRDLPLAMSLPRPVRRFIPPVVAQARRQQELSPESAPDVAPLIAQAPTMAIVGLDPAKTIDIPKPPPPRDAGFSAGPKPNPEGERAPAVKAMLSVPDLYASGGPKEIQPLTASGLPPSSTRNLMAAMPAGGVPRTPPGGPHAPHVSSSPDPRMDGRAIYMMAIQMPNVTSFSGSWMIWFAEHQALPGGPPIEMQPPEPMRKVDPKYIADAVTERVEGIVRLTAVIRKDGTIDEVELLKHLDDRLDRSAEEALAKWRFEPARRDGTPVDVDAVFEIPFRLAPRVAR
jgi:TonB family protein